ncbi:hypothetical protein CKO43_00080 [Rubrivivax gelatinosus]|uniref:Beta-ketoacyl synthase-like N-terminal domain-containing protein n=1 Tax=Rubrivivax gelatinosus TaxID=28068 RepID=A0ABS1DMC9_RUBGE|nr:hypothetical protein [Rubrivivax gelatinosus]
MEFVIADWSAWSPGLCSQEQWRDWAQDPVLPVGHARPELPEMQPMLRRRLDPLGRMAAQVVYWCQGERRDMPVVFASRYGEPARSLEMLAALAAAEPLSPTTFGLSVHNAIGAMVAIARGDRANTTAIAGGAATPAAALVEAGALLADGAAEVLVVCCDAPLPEPYAEFSDGPAAPWAWAWRLAAGTAGQPCLRLDWEDAGVEADSAAVLPFGLELLQTVLAPGPGCQRVVDGRRWHWSHDA